MPLWEGVNATVLRFEDVDLLSSRERRVARYKECDPDAEGFGLDDDLSFPPIKLLASTLSTCVLCTIRGSGPPT